MDTTTINREINKSLNVLKQGGIIVYPTDTIWGIGCDATSSVAVEKIYRIKKRSEAKSLITLVSDAGMLNRHVKNVPVLAWDLMELSEKPMTIIYDEVKGLAKNVMANDGTAAIRMVKDIFCQRLIHKLGKPIVSTSANISGELSPRNFFEISSDIISEADYVVDYRRGENYFTEPSSIIRLSENGEIKIIRK